MEGADPFQVLRTKKFVFGRKCIVLDDLAREFYETLFHFIGGLVGKGYSHNPTRISHFGVDEVGDFVGEGACFACSCTCEDE